MCCWERRGRRCRGRFAGALPVLPGAVSASGELGEKSLQKTPFPGPVPCTRPAAPWPDPRSLGAGRGLRRRFCSRSQHPAKERPSRRRPGRGPCGPRGLSCENRVPGKYLFNHRLPFCENVARRFGRDAVSSCRGRPVPEAAGPGCPQSRPGACRRPPAQAQRCCEEDPWPPPRPSQLGDGCPAGGEHRTWPATSRHQPGRSRLSSAALSNALRGWADPWRDFLVWGRWRPCAAVGLRRPFQRPICHPPGPVCAPSNRESHEAGRPPGPPPPAPRLQICPGLAGDPAPCTPPAPRPRTIPLGLKTCSEEARLSARGGGVWTFSLRR